MNVVAPSDLHHHPSTRGHLYVLHGGPVISSRDGQRHNLSAAQVAACLRMSVSPPSVVLARDLGEAMEVASRRAPEGQWGRVYVHGPVYDGAYDGSSFRRLYPVHVNHLQRQHRFVDVDTGDMRYCPPDYDESGHLPGDVASSISYLRDYAIGTQLRALVPMWGLTRLEWLRAVMGLRPSITSDRGASSAFFAFSSSVMHTPQVGSYSLVFSDATSEFASEFSLPLPAALLERCRMLLGQGERERAFRYSRAQVGFDLSQAPSHTVVVNDAIGDAPSDDRLDAIRAAVIGGISLGAASLRVTDRYGFVRAVVGDLTMQPDANIAIPKMTEVPEKGSKKWARIEAKGCVWDAKAATCSSYAWPCEQCPAYARTVTGRPKSAKVELKSISLPARRLKLRRDK